MKILTKEEEEDNYNETLKGGFIGGGVGLTLGAGGLYLATLRYPVFRQITIPLRFFLVTSSGTFGAIVTADHFSRAFEASRHSDEEYRKDAARLRQEEYEQKSEYDKFVAWGERNRYKIVGGSWVAAMGLSLGLVGRNPYLSTAQKLVQARVYAQSLTIAVLIASAAFEIADQKNDKGRWETVKIIDPKDPEHKHVIEKKVEKKEEHKGNQSDDQWKDMVEAEEQRIKQHEQAIQDQVRKDEKSGKFKPKDHKKKPKKEKKDNSQKDEKSDEKSDEDK